MPDTPHVFDGHNDTLLDLHRRTAGEDVASDEDGSRERSLFESTERGHLDLPRAREANFGGGLFAIFAPNDHDPVVEETEDGYEVTYASAVDHEYAKSFTYDLLADLHRLERESGERDDCVDFRVARSAEDVRACLDGDAVAAVPHLEGAAAVAPDLSNLDFLYAAGVRSIGLTWSRPNEFGRGVPFQYPRSPDTGSGLTDAGHALVDACNERGILVDLAHLNEAGFWDVAERSTDPLVVSHAAVHDICASTRNLTDEQLDAVAASGGIVGITFSASDLRPDGGRATDVPLSVVADHVEYVADRVGVDHVALGSDFDGTAIVDSVGDVTGLPRLFDALRERGFGEDGLEAVARENWLRVLESTWG
ncbi:dipeptidase [Halobacterium zhouii]|uniref:dipeptidase n=1 Tax=Halobacterium zhouii TaxID=2902624 RepID=UPI001E366CA5|nr:dipeptidase [Halobacterium zhouii]